MANAQLRRFKTISEFHKFRGLPKPEHPLISVINLEMIDHLPANEWSLVNDFYSISLKRNFNVKIISLLLNWKCCSNIPNVFTSGSLLPEK